MKTLLDCLEEARNRGFLGPGPVDVHVEHARSFLAVLPHEGRILDLGSGGGIPGLVIAIERPHLDLVLFDAGEKRTDFLQEAVDALDLGGRVEVRRGRAEELGREQREMFDVVVARSFAPPGPTAECASPLLRVGGLLVVSEPPEPGSDRWPSAGLAELGIELGELHSGEGATLRVLRRVGECPERYPRRVGVPFKRPLF